MKILKKHMTNQNNPSITMNKTIVLILLLLFTISGIKSQQYPIYTQYTLNKFVYNPATTGMNGYATINFIAREELVGFRGTPKTHVLTFDTRILADSYILRTLSVRKKKPRKTRGGNTAFGGYIISDLNGPIDKTWVNTSYAYHIDMRNAQLSFGLSLQMFQLNIQGDEFILPDDVPDELLTDDDQSIWIMDANFGAYYTTREYYVGYSTIQLFNSNAQFGENLQGEYQLVRQHNLIGGYKYPVSRFIDIETSALIKVLEKTQTQADLNIKGTYDKKYWAGINYRTKTAFSIFGGFTYSRYDFGYALDLNISPLTRKTLGSHEVVIIARLGNARRYKWLNTY